MKKTSLFILAVFCAATSWGQTTSSDKQNTQSSAKTGSAFDQRVKTVRAERAGSAINRSNSSGINRAAAPMRSPEDVIFFDDFESAVAPNLPDGWTLENNSTTENWYIWLNNTVGYFPSGVKGLTNDDYNGTRNAWAFTHGFTLTAGVTYNISFWLNMPGYDGDYDSFELKIGMSASSEYMSNTIFSRIDAPSTDRNWELVEETFTPITTGTYYLGFHAFSPYYNGDYIDIDDVLVTEYSACTKPTITNAVSTEDGAIVSLHSNGYESQWQYAVSTNSAANPETLTVIDVATDTFTISGLAPNTQYYIWVRSYCDATDQSKWVAGSFTTLLCDNLCEYRIEAEDSYGDGWNGGKIIVKNGSNVLAEYGLASGYSGQGILQICPTLPITFEWEGGNWLYEISFKIYDPNGELISEVETDNLNGLYSFSTISCPAPPTCPKPAITNVTSTSNSVTVELTENGGATDWQYAFSTNSAADPETLTVIDVATDTFTIEGLNPSVLYHVWVRSICGVDDESLWVKGSFVTECGNVSVPYTENFTGWATGSANWTNPCWKRYNGGFVSTSYPYVHAANNGSTNSSSGAPYLHFSNSNFLTAVLPPFDINVNTLHIDFWSNRESGSSGTFSVGYLTAIEDPTTFVAVETFDDIEDIWLKHSVPLNFVPAGINNIALRQNQLSSGYRYWIDDISISKKITVRWRNDLNWSGDMYIYAWNDGNELAGAWPGTIADINNDGWYSYSFNADSVNVIFNNGYENSQTVNIEGITENSCFRILNEQQGSWYNAMALDCSLENAPLHGIYTIDNTKSNSDRNFNSFRYAVAALNSRGISDTVTFEVIAGQVHDITLTDYRGLRIISGGTVDKPVTFRKSGSEANPLLKVTGTSDNSDICFYLQNVNYITFDGIDIENAGTTEDWWYGNDNHLDYAFYLENTSNISILNCNIQLHVDKNSYYYYERYGIYTTVTQNLFTNNVAIKNAHYGYVLLYGSDNTICKNKIDSTGTGIYIYGTQNNFTLKESKITNAEVGVYLSGNGSKRIYNNLIHAANMGIYSENWGWEDTAHIAHNTVYIPLNSYNNDSYCLYNYGRVSLCNNIFINKSTGASSRSIYNSDNDNILQGSNNNIYYCRAGAIYSNSSISKNTIAEYADMLGDGRESNSCKADAPFVSTTYPFNFNIKTDVPAKAESGGQPLAWVLTDIDGNERSPLTPDIGAYEFDGIIDNTVVVPLAGIYTIDNTQPTENRNFNTFEDAIAELNETGISDTVIFEVIAGQVHDIALSTNLGLRIISGGAVDKPIVFRKSGSEANPLLKVTGMSGNSDVCFYLQNVNYITFDGIDIENAGMSSSNYLERGFYLIGASNIRVINCNIRLQNAYDSYGIYITGTENALYTENVKIKNAEYGYYFNSSGLGNTICKNEIDSINIGIYVNSNQNDFTIKESKITNAEVGVYLSGNGNKRIYNNLIHAANMGIYSEIWGWKDTVHIAHNTVYIPLDSYNYDSYCLYNGYGRLNLCNNIFINKSNSSYSYSFYNYSEILEGSNNNIYYCANGYVYNELYTVGDYIEMLGDGRESNSYQEDIPFISATYPYNFSIKTDVPTQAESGGQPLAWVPTDMEGKARDPFMPDIGAYEFEGVIISCYSPIQLAANDITAVSAKIVWQSKKNVSAFNIEYGEAGFVRGNGEFITLTDTNSFTLTDLLSNTSYDFYVQAVCGNEDVSEWSAITFSTEQIPAQIPYSCDFENPSENKEWTLLNDNQTNQWHIGSVVSKEGSNSLYISNTGSTHNYNTTATSYVYAYRPLDFVEAGYYSFKFDWLCLGETGYDILRAFLVPASVSLSAGNAYGMTGSANTVPSNWIAITPVLGYQSNWQSISTEIEVKNAGLYNLVFFWKNDGSAGSQPPAAVDNISIELVSTCFKPAITIATATSNSVTVELTETGSAANWQYVFSTNSAADPETLTVIDIATDTFTISGLYKNTQYYFWARSYCDATNQSFWVNSSFKTESNVFVITNAVPFIEDFEDPSENMEWTLLNDNQTNQWHIGSVVSQNGSNSLYISNTGATHNYDITATSYVYAYRALNFVETGKYSFKFDWLCLGETDYNGYDILRAFLVPASVSLYAGNAYGMTGSANTIPSNWIAITPVLEDQSNWQSISTGIEVTNAGLYNLVLFWKNDGSVGSQPPAAVDNIRIEIAPPFSGVYTIDNRYPTENRNFNTFEEAIATLNSSFVADTVIFEVIAEQVHNIALTNNQGLQIITGGTVDKPIIFRKSGSGANPLLKVTGTSNSSDACFYLDNVNYITFDGIDIENAGTASSNYIERGFYLNNASHINIRNCNIKLINSNATYGFYISSSNNNYFYYNNISQVETGYYFINNLSNNHIEGGIIEGVIVGIEQYYYYRHDNLIIEKVKIAGLNSNAYGIYIGFGNNQYISNNTITGFNRGIYCLYGNSTDTVYIAHNTILTLPTGNVYGINNSSLIKMELSNNIIINKSTSSSSYCFYNTTSDNSNILQGSNNNIYHSEYGAIYSTPSVSKYNVHDYIELLGDGRESNSYQEDVPFISAVAPFNFNINPTAPTKAESGGQPLSWVQTDIDGNTRNASTPDIGAYEFDGIVDNTDLSPLHGVYTINNILPTANRNFNTFKDAVATLNSRGTSDTVIFEVIAGQVHDIALTDYRGLRIVSGGTIDKPITFVKSGSGANPLLKVTGTSNSYSDMCFYLDGVNYIIFDGIDIENAGTLSTYYNNNQLEYAFYLTNASNITITNNNIKLAQSSYYTNYGIYTTGSCNNNSYQNSKIKQSYYGIYFNGANTNNPVTNTVTDCVIDSVSYGIYGYYQNNFTVKKSKITNANTGIYLNYGNNKRIYNNVIHATSIGVYLDYSFSTDTIYLAHNTVYIPTTSNTVYCLQKYSSSYNGKLGLYNNIFINKSTSSSSSCFYNYTSDNSNILQSSNNNIYQKTNGYIYQNYSVTASDLEAYRTLLADNRESNSIEEDVPFVNTVYPFDFNVRTDIPTAAESGGKIVSWVNTDIDGNPRYGNGNYGGSGSAPDIGAYEFEGKGIFFQSICSGDSTELVDFTNFYQGANVTYQLTQQPLSTTGYITSGVDVLPKMELINSSNNLDTLVYTVTPATGTPLNYTVTVRPQMQIGNFSENMFPANNTVVPDLSVNFSWQAVQGAAFYDIYIWNENAQCPAQPTRANLQAIQYTHSSNFAYGNKYRWKVVAKNLCMQIESETCSFEMRILPDLHVTQVNISAAYSGQNATVSWTVKNDGQGATVEPLWYDYIWLVDIATDGSDAMTSRLLATVPNVQGLNVGESYSNSAEVTIPERVVGTYYIFVASDMQYISSIDWTPTGMQLPPVPYTPSITGNPYPYLFAYNYYKTVAEVSRYNSSYYYDNFFYIQFEILPSPVPDLIVTTASFPNSVFSGQTLENVIYEVKNQGGAIAQGSWVDAVYMSLEPDFNGNARFLKNIYHNNMSLQVGNSYTETTTLQIPNYILGEYYIFIKTNATDAIYESVYFDNNTYRSPNMLTVFLTPPPDLAPTNITAPTMASVKEQCTVSYTISNQGLNPTPENYWRDRIYLSPTSTFNQQTAVLAADYYRYGALAIEDSYTVQLQVTIPDNISGTWYFFVYTDAQNYVFEYTGEDNNILACSHATEIVCPNLELAGIRINTNPLLAGENASISYKVKNIGTGKVNNVSITDKLYISTSSTYNTSQLTLLDSYDYSLTLAAGDSIVQTKNVKLPCAAAGNYYIYAATDVNQKVFEQGNIQNNHLGTSAQSILSPDLIITDLTLPSAGGSGQPVTIDYTVKNNHNATLNNKTVKTKFYVSTQSAFNEPTATYIGEHNVALNLAPAATQTLQTACNLPNGISGDYYLYARVNADNAICENNTSNNVTRSATIAVTLSPWVDFIVTQIEKPDTCVAGSHILMQYEAKNVGTAALINGAWNDNIYISAKMFLDNTATLLQTVNRTGDLAIGETYAENLYVTIPAALASGNYYLLVATDAADNYYEHLSENNNILVSDKIFVNEYPLDLAAITLQVPATTPWGATVSVELQAKNISEKNTLVDTWFDGFYLSTDSVYNASSIFLKEQKHIGHLLPDGNYSVTTNCAIPNGLQGNYWLLAVVDYKGANHDINRSNNFVGRKITISAVPSPDLTITNFEVLDSPVSGQPFRATYTIKNNGTGNIINTSWNDYIILSTNPTAPASGDAILSNKLKQMSLFSGQSYCDTVMLTVPLPKEGNFILWLKTDANNNIYEHNGENNNLTSAPVAVYLPQPGDLQPCNIQSEIEIISGNYLHINYDIRNNANTSMTGNNLKDLVYLATDTVFDINSKLVGQVTGSVNLPPYGSLNRSVTARVSGIKEGDYYLIVKTDVQNAFNETNKDNNTALSVYPLRVRLRTLPVNTPLPDSLLNNLANDYKLETDTITGETVLVYLQSADSLLGATNNLYIKLNDVADNINFDISSDGQFSPNPQVYIPSTEPEYYGVNFRGNTPAGNQQDVVIQADILPFEIRSISPNYGGNTGRVTVEILGAKFTPEMEVWLEKDSAIIDADTLIYVGFHKVFAVFNLNGQDIGKYTVGAFNFCQGESFLEDGFEILDGAAEELATNLILPSSSRPNRTVSITFEYANLGNTDILHPVVEIRSHADSPIGLTQADLNDNKTVLPIVLQVAGDPEGVLRPGSYGTVTFYAYTSGGLIFTIERIK